MISPRPRIMEYEDVADVFMDAAFNKFDGLLPRAGGACKQLQRERDPRHCARIRVSKTTPSFSHFSDLLRFSKDLKSRSPKLIRSSGGIPSFWFESEFKISVESLM
ncbi:hypothetical protein AAC387_Pa09g1432 [Persea americana]